MDNPRIHVMHVVGAHQDFLEVAPVMGAMFRHIVFPMHPRTRQRMRELAPSRWPEQLHLLDPSGYFDFLALMRKATVVVTDSGGVQEETTYLGIPCLTVRPNTERPVTITHGTNRLVASQRDALVSAIEDTLHLGAQSGGKEPPALWDGQAAQRIVDVFLGVSQAGLKIRSTGE